MSDEPETQSVEIRALDPADQAGVEALYAAAFPDEDLVPLVRALLEEPDSASLVAAYESGVLGHAALTACEVDDGGPAVLLLGPIAVAPHVQKAGLGGAMLRAALAGAAQSGASHVLVLGDPGYYERFGFMPEAGIEPAYPIPDAWRSAWRSIALSRTPTPRLGRLQPPAPWRDPALWAPAEGQG
jgi:putative acetyltransferase